MSSPRLLTLLLASGALVPLAPALAAESYANCNTFIDSLPATISTQGVSCLRKDLATTITSGAAITLAANNITIDCNGFKLGGLAAGPDADTSGIRGFNKRNATVRNCNVRGFRYGINLDGEDGGGHQVEDNRLDNNLEIGINARGEANLVRRNRVYDTGGRPDSDQSYGMFVSGDAIDNTVAGVFATASDASSKGIWLHGSGGEVRNNRVRGLLRSGIGSAAGIYVTATGAALTGNRISAQVRTDGWGILAISERYPFCRDNTLSNFATAQNGCQDMGGNGSN